MTSIVAREMVITYNSYTVGGDQANRILEDIYMSEEDYEKGILEFTFTVRHDSQSAFVNECVAAEIAFRTPRKDTVVSQGGSNIINWSHTNSFGYNAMPKISKSGDAQYDGGWMRRYRVRIEVGLPADVVNTSFRRNSFVNVAYSPSRRRTVTISGTYTANGTTTARAQYLASFDAYATSVLNTIGGTYKKLEEPQGTADDQNKEINFATTYEEIIYTGVGAADPTLRGEQLTITRSRVSPGDTPGPSTVERLIHITALYEAWFDNTVTTAITAKWESMRSQVVAAIQGTLTGGSIAVTGEAPSFDLTNNKFTVTLECVGSTTNGLLEYRETIANDIFTGKVLVGVTTGNYLDKYPFGGPGKFQRTVTQAFTSIQGADPPLFTAGALEPPTNFGGAPLKSAHISTHRDTTPTRWGLPNYSQQIDARKVTYVRVFEFYTEPQGGVATPGGGSQGGSSGGGSVSTGGGSSPGQSDSTPSGGDGGGYVPQDPSIPDIPSFHNESVTGSNAGSAGSTPP